MDAKNLIGLVLIFAALRMRFVVCWVGRRAREAAFFLMIALTVFTGRLGIEFASHYWYRGTTRGFEVTVVDILTVGMLISSILLPPRGQPRWFWPASLGALLLYLFYGCFSVAISDPKL